MTARPPFRLIPEQYDLLTRELTASRVGRNPKGFSHLEAWDVRRWLTRIFGFGGFAIETVALDLVKEIEHPIRRRKDKNGNEYGDPYVPWTAVYRAQVRLTVYDQFGGHAVFEDGACGDSSNQPSLGDCHDNAMKTALSQALKRCAVNLGDQFGLSLYNGGGTRPVVLRSVVAPVMPSGDAPAAELPADDAPVMPEPGSVPAADEHQADEPTTAAPEQPAPPSATSVRDWALAKDRTADGINRAAAKLAAEHPAVAAAEVTNETGEPELLGVLLARRVRELNPAPTPDEERCRRRMHALYNDVGIRDREERLTIAALAAGRDITSTNDLAWPDEVEAVITALETRQRQQTQGVAA